MAEGIGLEVKIGLDVSEMQAELQKSQNLLKQFEAQLRKSTDVTEIKKLTIEIAKLNSDIGSMNAQMSKVAKPTSDATQSLVNLSRIAQDAPYGFIGIANNLNPMLESFQRLQKEAGGSSSALKAMVSGLMGPAGIGLALGVVSSLLVKFGGDISEFAGKLINGNNSIKEYADSLKASQKAYIDAYVEVYKLGKSFDDFHNGLKTKKEVLNEYNTTLGETYGKTNDVAEAEKIWANNSENFIKAAILRAASLDQIAKAAKKSSEAFETAQKPKEEFTSILAFGGAGMGGASAINMQSQLDKQRKASQADAVADIKKEEQFHLDVNKAIEAKLKLLKDEAVYSKYIGQELPKTITGGTKPSEESEMNKMLNMELAKIKARADQAKALGTGQVDLYKKPEEVVSAESKRLSGISAFGKSKMTGDFGKGLEENAKILAEQYKLEDANNKLRLKAIDDQNQAYLKFADTIAGTATNALMGLWDAMQQGVPIGEALGNMFADLAKQIAAAAIKAAIFSAISSALGVPAGAIAGGASTATGAGGGFLGMFGSLLGLAEGGLVTKPTLAMIGEGNQHEAVMPLSKLSSMMSTTFNAGKMSSGGNGGGNGQFVLKGNDLVLALQRSNYSLNLRRG